MLYYFVVKGEVYDENQFPPQDCNTVIDTNRIKKIKNGKTMQSCILELENGEQIEVVGNKTVITEDINARS